MALGRIYRYIVYKTFPERRKVFLNKTEHFNYERFASILITEKC